jgi:hypothetical protein
MTICLNDRKEVRSIQYVTLQTLSAKSLSTCWQLYLPSKDKLQQKLQEWAGEMGDE